MGIHEKTPTPQEYVVIFRNNQAITLSCTDIRTSQGWVKFEEKAGKCVMATPADLILMIILPEHYASMQKATEDEKARLEARARIEAGVPTNVDPQGILDPSTRIVQP